MKSRFNLGLCSFGQYMAYTRDLRIVFFVRIESRIESAVRFVFESNLRIESAVYTTQAVTRPDGPQAFRTGL